MSRCTRWALVLAAGLFVVGSVESVVSRPAGAEGSFRGLASASGLRVTMKVANAPATDTPFDVGGPVAQAVLDSLGTRDAYASSPYPGELVVLGPGLLAGFWGQTPFAQFTGPPQLGSYPFFVNANAQQPEAKQTQGPSQLEAQSAEGRSHGRATTGTKSDQMTLGSAVADGEVVRQDSGDVVATALDDVQSFAVGPLRLGSVHSKAVVSRKTDGSVSKDTQLVVTGATINDVSVEITPQGIKTPGGPAPLPANDQFTKALQQAGISIAFVDRQDLPDGVVGAGLRISQTFDAPRFGVGGMTYTLGQTTAVVGGAPGSPALPTGDSVPPVSGGSDSSGSGGVPGTGSATSGGLGSGGTSSGTGGTGGGSATGGYSRSGGATGSTGSSSSALGAAQSAGAPLGGGATTGSGEGQVLGAAPASAPGARSFGVKGSYLVAVAGALVLAALAQLTSLLGVRARWS